MTISNRRALVMIGLVLLLTPASFARQDGVTIEEQGDELVITVNRDGDLVRLVEACQPFLEFELLFERIELKNRIPPWKTKTVKRSELWTSLQPLWLAMDFAFVWLDEDTVSLLNRRVGQRGELTGHARTVTLEETLEGRIPVAEVVTIAVPLEHIDARGTFSSMRQYFTNQQYEQLTPIDGSNTLVMTGLGGMIAKQVELVRSLDRPDRMKIEHEFRRYEIEHASANAVVEDVRRFLELRQPKNAPTNPIASRPREIVLRVAGADALVVWARPETLALMDELIALLDQGDEEVEEPAKGEKQSARASSTRRQRSAA
ncbi:MAG: hypothetical protein RL885_32195 [Planctomycetota bacterium]